MKTHFYLDEIIKICDHHHLSADEIFHKLQKNYPTVAKASIYRNIEKLVAEKKLSKVVSNDRKVFYEKTIEPHIHFVCQKSGKICDLPIDISKLNLTIPENFLVENIDITIYGEELE